MEGLNQPVVIDNVGFVNDVMKLKQLGYWVIESRICWRRDSHLDLSYIVCNYARFYSCVAALADRNTGG